jgi:hypothetical protein
MTAPWRIALASLPDREKLVAEIFFGTEQWAEISQEKQALEVEFYARSDGQPWRIPLQTAVEALQDAERRLR